MRVAFESTKESSICQPQKYSHRLDTSLAATKNVRTFPPYSCPILLNPGWRLPSVPTLRRRVSCRAFFLTRSAPAVPAGSGMRGTYWSKHTSGGPLGSYSIRPGT